jgi:DNA-binding NarL/FixJ family response regulator
MKILIVDKHILFRDGLKSVLSKQPGFTVIGEAGTIKSALEKTLEHNPDLVLMNINLPDGNGLDTIKEILYHRPETKIVILTKHDNEDYFLRAIRNGADGYLLKNIPVGELIKAISRKMTKQLVDELHRVGNGSKPDTSRFDLLTFREVEVLRYLGDGFSNGEIADQLSIAENTVRVHVHSILKKFNFRSRREVYHFIRRQNYDVPIAVSQRQ